jgi:hypothetical protein
LFFKYFFLYQNKIGGSGLIGGVAFGGSGLIRGVAFGRSGLIRGVAFGESGLIRGVVFGGSGLIRGVVFGGSGLIRGGLLYNRHQYHISSCNCVVLGTNKGGQINLTVIY